MENQDAEQQVLDALMRQIMMRQGGSTQTLREPPALTPPVQSSYSPSSASMASPMQGIAQVANAAAGLFRGNRRVMDGNQVYPAAPLGGGIFSGLTNPFVKYTTGGGGLY